MMASNPPPFRLRRLLNPFHLVRRLGEMRSFADLRLTVANVFVYIGGHVKNGYYDARGVPHYLRARAETLYYKIDAPRLLSRAAARFSDEVMPATPPAAAPAPPAPPSFEHREPV